MLALRRSAKPERYVLKALKDESDQRRGILKKMLLVPYPN
jgi:hypothetical protein